MISSRCAWTVPSGPIGAAVQAGVDVSIVRIKGVSLPPGLAHDSANRASEIGGNRRFMG
jgi:hypothetical protein